MNDVFKAIADPTRREILKILDKGEKSAGEIADNFTMARPSVTHHLNILKNANLIDSKKEGQNVIYRLNSEVFGEVLNWFYDFSFYKNQL